MVQLGRPFMLVFSYQATYSITCLGLDGHLIHVSQVALGDVKNSKAANYVPVRMKVEYKKFVIGTLSADKGPQISFDLVLDKDFELSHDWKDGSIYFCGYTAEQDDGSDGPEGFYDDEGESSHEL
ncbi:NPL domain-containing protein [Heracleum sosnowskyi]|uniref:NPL domain-containing protein n=1 Tax=Heracleum sosnowskyi TaxID=360622 RepID=A0AAD8ITT0_9APIA|nr:NPL domain-containing protein [Heracleum sosnowskyi]